MREIKSFPFKINQVEATGEFTGYASTFGDVDLGHDVIEKGAFKKTLFETKGRIPVLDHHDPTKQIGWNLEAKEDDRGLLVQGLLDLNVRAARERHSLMKMAIEVGGQTGLMPDEVGWSCFYCGNYIFRPAPSLHDLWFHFKVGREYWRAMSLGGDNFINGVPVSGLPDSLPRRLWGDLTETRPPKWFKYYIVYDEEQFQKYLEAEGL
jgi:hypothetical protein